MKKVELKFKWLDNSQDLLDESVEALQEARSKLIDCISELDGLNFRNEDNEEYQYDLINFYEDMLDSLKISEEELESQAQRILNKFKEDIPKYGKIREY